MTATVETIHGFFEQYGWHAEFDDQTTTWLTGFRGTGNNFNVMVHLTNDWLYFIISPFVNAPEDEVCAHKLNFYLLRLNHAINMAKFSIDADGDVVLTVELPTESLDYSEFSDGINALSYYADEHFKDVFNVARDPAYEALLPDREAAEPWRPPDGTSAPN